MEIVEERGAHIGVAHPVLFEGAGGGHGDDAGHDDDERRADQHDGSSGHVNRRNGHEQGDWRKNRIEELRQEQFKEALNLFNTFAGGLHHIRGLDAGFVGRAECHHFAVQLGSQSQFDPLGGFGAEAGGMRGGRVPNHYADQSKQRVNHDVASHGQHIRAVLIRQRHGAGHALRSAAALEQRRCHSGQQAVQQHYQRQHKTNVGKQTYPHQCHFAGYEFFQAGRQLEQSFVEHGSFPLAVLTAALLQ